MGQQEPLNQNQNSLMYREEHDCEGETRSRMFRIQLTAN